MLEVITPLETRWPGGSLMLLFGTGGLLFSSFSGLGCFSGFKTLFASCGLTLLVPGYLARFRIEFVPDVVEQYGGFFKGGVCFFGGLQHLSGFIDPAGFHVEPSECIERTGMVRFHFNGLLVAAYGAFIILLEFVDQAEFVVVVGIVGKQFGRAFEQPGDLIVLLVFNVDGNQGITGIHVVFLLCQRLGVMFDRLVVGAFGPV